MEIQLQELINQIRKEGVEASEAEAREIIEKAKAEAEKIVKDAEIKAEKIIADAKSSNEKALLSGEAALRQAGRNILISFRESVARELNAVTGESVSAVYSSDALKDIIVKAIECRVSSPDSGDIAVIMNSNDLKRLEEGLLSALRERLITGVTLKANDNFDGGFRIAVKNGDIYYDYSKDEVTDMLSCYLSPKITKLLKEAE